MEIGEMYLEGNPDAVEFCPHIPFHTILAASTYTLQNSIRHGTLSLFHLPNNINPNHHHNPFQMIYSVDTAGIFDIKWAPVFYTSFGPFIAQADADGCLKIHQMVSQEENARNKLKEIAGKQVSSSMCLCLDWNPSATSIAVGLSNGSVSIISFQESKLCIQQDWEAHQFEVWASSFDIHQPQLVYTGSDDCRFSCWDLREGTSTLAFQNSKTHTMGVCCITKSPNDPHTLLTGSYDEYLRVWDMRSMAKPVTETSICLGGGVWRIKYHPYVPGVILAACMHNGFSIVKIEGEKAEVVESYKKHESLAYGADWQRGESFLEGKRKNSVVATCSFYDRLLRIWVPESEI